MNTESKKILFVMRHAPYGSSLAREGLDAILAYAAFDQQISVLFLHDGVFQLTSNQQSESIDQKSLEKSLTALPLYGVNDIYLDHCSLINRQLAPENLSIEGSLLSKEQVSQLFNQHNTIFQF